MKGYGSGMGWARGDAFWHFFDYGLAICGRGVSTAAVADAPDAAVPACTECFVLRPDYQHKHREIDVTKHGDKLRRWICPCGDYERTEPMPTPEEWLAKMAAPLRAGW